MTFEAILVKFIFDDMVRYGDMSLAGTTGMLNDRIASDFSTKFR